MSLEAKSDLKRNKVRSKFNVIYLDSSNKDWDNARHLVTNDGLKINEESTCSAAYTLGSKIPLGI
jgi:hypothetical protein